MHGAAGADGEVQAVPGRVQVSQGGAEADPVVIVADARPDTGGVGAVVVRAIGESCSPAGAVEGLLFRMPSLPPGVVNEDGTVGAMKVIPVVHIGLGLPEIRQGLLVAPTVVSQRGPVVQIPRVSSVEG